jgi:DNA N-6-adenine-methyltransferase (Dam)
MALHEQSVGATSEWYTPPYVFEALGCRFDVDVASPGCDVVPWVPAIRHIVRDSMITDWGDGFAWMNPPFGGRNALIPWLQKFVDHGNGVALVPDRTSAPWWQAFAPQMDALLFVAPKIRFIGADGQPSRSPAQGTTLFAIGVQGRQSLQNAAVHDLGLMVYL